MTQRWIPAVFIRGGTSKGLFFHDRDLPVAPAERDAVFLASIGAPDPYGRQLNGMGGGVSSLSKVMIVKGSTRADADVEYTFGQVAIDQPVVDYAANCGNLSSAVGPFAIDEGLVERPDGPVELRLYNTNTDKIIVSRFNVSNGTAETLGDCELPGVAGTGAPVELQFLEPGGSRTGRLLPTDQVTDHVPGESDSAITVSLVDASNPLVIVGAQDLGLSGVELPEEIEARTEVMTQLDQIRRFAGVAMGLGERPEDVALSVPKVAVVSAPQDYCRIDGAHVSAADYDLGVRMVSMQQIHRAITGTGALGLAVAANIEGTLAHRVCTAPGPGELRLGTASGVLSVSADVTAGSDGPTAHSASLFRTARALMRGSVAVPLQ